MRSVAKDDRPSSAPAFWRWNRSVVFQLREHSSSDAGRFMWAITCLLLSFVSAIFAFGGTAGEQGGHYARVVMVGFLMMALVMLFIRRSSRDQH